MKCPKCGIEIEDERAINCSFCGANLSKGRISKRRKEARKRRKKMPVSKKQIKTDSERIRTIEKSENINIGMSSFKTPQRIIQENTEFNRFLQQFKELKQQTNLDDLLEQLRKIKEMAHKYNNHLIIQFINEKQGFLENISLLKKLFIISKKLRISDVAEMIERDEKKFVEDLKDWEKNFPQFSIGGDFIVVDRTTSEISFSEISQGWDVEFDQWERREITKEGKIN